MGQQRSIVIRVDPMKLTRRHIEHLTKGFKAMFDREVEFDFKRIHTLKSNLATDEIVGRFRLELNGQQGYNETVSHRFKEQASLILRDENLRLI